MASKPTAKILFLLFLLPTALLPAFSQAMTLEREGGNDAKICSCDFTAALLRVEGKENEKFALLVETDGQIKVDAPGQAKANFATRLFLSVACNAPKGAKLFEISARSLESGRSEKKLFSLQAVECPRLVLRRLATLAYCPSRTDFEMELENSGPVSEKGEFSASVVEGLAQFSPAKFSLAPGEKMVVTLEVGIPPHLLSRQHSENIKVKAMGVHASALATVSLIMPICASPQPLIPAVSPPAPVQMMQAGFGSIKGENFLTGFFLGRSNELTAWLSSLSGTRFADAKGWKLPENSLLIAGAALVALLLIAGYAFNKERQASKEEKKLAEKRRERLSAVRSEVE